MRIAEAAGFPDEEIHKIGMAVREGVINAYNYGNQQDRQKKILMTVELAPEDMTVRIIDQGQGFELTEIPDPLAPEEKPVAHLRPAGLFLMRAFMDELQGPKTRPRAGGAPTRNDQETGRIVHSGNGKHQSLSRMNSVRFPWHLQGYLQANRR